MNWYAILLYCTYSLCHLSFHKTFNHKRALWTKFAAKYSRFSHYFWRLVFYFKLSKTYISIRSRKSWEDLKKFEKKKFRILKKHSTLIPIPKLDFGFGSQYRILVSDVHYNKDICLLSIALHLCTVMIEP